MQSERVTYLTSAEQKAALEAFAKARGESVGNVVREATARYMAQSSDDEEAELAVLVAELVEALPTMQANLERSINNTETTLANVDRLLREAGIRK